MSKISYRGLKRSYIDFKRHPWLHFVSLSTISMALLIVSVFFLCYRNMDYMADRAKSHSSGTAYLKDTVKSFELATLKEKILQLPGVRAITFKNKESVMDELQLFLGTTSVEPLAAEIFPDVLEIEIKQNASADTVSDLRAMISEMPEISDVDFSEDWMQQFQKLRRFIGIFGFILTLGAITGCGFIIANFMGMRHQARRHEIEIVRLHGAHRNFILSPFLWEGAIEGICGSVLALFSVYLLKAAFNLFLTPQWVSLLGIEKLLYLSPWQMLATIAIGIAMAFFGSITVFLRFQES